VVVVVVVVRLQPVHSIHLTQLLHVLIMGEAAEAVVATIPLGTRRVMEVLVAVKSLGVAEVLLATLGVLRVLLGKMGCLGVWVQVAGVRPLSSMATLLGLMGDKVVYRGVAVAAGHLADLVTTQVKVAMVVAAKSTLRESSNAIRNHRQRQRH
jgi:hypothetical protein